MKKQNTYNSQTAKFIAKVCENMPEILGDVMQWWIQHPDETKRVLENFQDLPQRRWQVWRTITLGTNLRTANDFFRKFKEDNYQITQGIEEILRFVMGDELIESSIEREVELVKVSVAELYFPKGTTQENIYKSAKRFGLDLCTTDIALQFFLQCGKKQSKSRGECPLTLSIAMEPILDLSNTFRVFSVHCDSKGNVCVLNTSCGHHYNFCSADRGWIFLHRPRK